jgi:hypothetical protein
MLADPLWPKGKHATYDAFVIEVGVRKDQDGTWRSYRRLQDAQDQEVVEKLGPSRGLEEGSFALLTETVRTEAMLQLLVKLSNEPESQRKLASAEKAPEELIEKLREVTLKQLKLSLDKMVSGLVRETVEQVHDGLRRESSG